MKTLIIFYSFEGNTKLLANAIAKETGADILKLKPKKDIKSKGLTKYLWGGKQVIFNEKPEIEEYDINPQEYDLIFIGTPVWSLTYTPAINSFLDNHGLENKKVVLFCTHEGWIGKTLTGMKRRLRGNKIVAQKDFLNVFQDEKNNLVEAVEWVREIKKLIS